MFVEYTLIKLFAEASWRKERGVPESVIENARQLIKDGGDKEAAKDLEPILEKLENGEIDQLEEKDFEELEELVLGGFPAYPGQQLEWEDEKLVEICRDEIAWRKTKENQKNV